MSSGTTAGRPGSRVRVEPVVLDGGDRRRRDDWVATEEPLQMQVSAGGDSATVAVTMRTPGEDFELAAGFLLAEGIVRRPGDVEGIRYCVDRELDEDQRFNVLTVDLTASRLPDLDRLERYGTVTSACGVCGKASLDALAARGLQAVPPSGVVDPDVLRALPERLREALETFRTTGGLHAAGAFTAAGELLAVREDVGRHNALDKLLGWALLDGRLPLTETVVMVSGRASFELVQKAVVAGAPCLAAVSAPSSLAVETAERFGMTLVGFLRGQRGNVYTRPDRLTGS